MGCVLSSSNLKVIQAPPLVRGQIQPDVPLVALFFQVLHTRAGAHAHPRTCISSQKKAMQPLHQTFFVV